MMRIAYLSAVVMAVIVVLGIGAGEARAEVLTVKVSNAAPGEKVECKIGDGSNYKDTKDADKDGNVTFTFETKEAPENGSEKWAAHAEGLTSKKKGTATRWSASGTTFGAKIALK